MALEINPSSGRRHVFLAGEAVDAGKRDDARKSLQNALEVNPSSLEAHALMAGLAYIEDKTPEFEAGDAKVLAIAPNYGEAYRVAAEMASHNYRYDDAVGAGAQGDRARSEQRAHSVRPGHASAADRRRDRARVRCSSIRSSSNGYNQVTYNLLQMMDTLDKFVTVRDGDLIIRMDKDEAPVLQELGAGARARGARQLHQALQVHAEGSDSDRDLSQARRLCRPHRRAARHGRRARRLLRPRRDDGFAARAAAGEFQWEATLWHELAHVITLQMSNNRVPRWLTEGISVCEEKLHRPEWSRGMDMTFASMLNRKETLKLKDLNAAFTDARTISLAYYEASLLVEHIVANYGEDGLHKLLNAYGQGARLRCGAEDGLEHRHRSAPGRVRSNAREDVRQAARGVADRAGRRLPEDARATTSRSTRPNTRAATPRS